VASAFVPAGGDVSVPGAAVARGAADEVVRAGLRERDLGVLVAVRLDGVAGGAGAVVRRAHLRDRTELQYY
jgi:hypothetical protein